MHQGPKPESCVSRKSMLDLGKADYTPRKERDIPTNETSLEAFPHVEDQVLNMNRLD